MVSLNYIRSQFEQIKSRGYVISIRPDQIKNDGAVGNTFENAFGVKENNDPGSDFEGWEFKSHRKKSNSFITLFSLKLDSKVNDKYMLDRWGMPDIEYHDIKCLRTSLYAHRYSKVNDKYDLKLQINKNKKKLFIVEKKKLDEIIYWNFDTLFKRASIKLKCLIFVTAKEKQIKQKTHFKYTSAEVHTRFKSNQFINLLGEGFIRYDHRIGIYKTGKYKGKQHNHGGGFRIAHSNLHKLFNIHTCL